MYNQEYDLHSKRGSHQAGNQGLSSENNRVMQSVFFPEWLMNTIVCQRAFQQVLYGFVVCCCQIRVEMMVLRVPGIASRWFS